MKQFDIENLKKKMPYELPEHTFEAVQKRVLAETTVSKQAQISNFKWFYAAAAVMLLLIGFGFYINSNSPEQNLDTKVLAAKTQGIMDVNQGADSAEISSNNINEKQSFAENHANENTTDLTSRSFRNPTIRNAANTPLEQKPASVKTVSVTTEKQVDNVLDGFSQKEITSLMANSEQDVYLDLYN